MVTQKRLPQTYQSAHLNKCHAQLTQPSVLYESPHRTDKNTTRHIVNSQYWVVQKLTCKQGPQGPRWTSLTSNPWWHKSFRERDSGRENECRIIWRFDWNTLKYLVQRRGLYTDFPCVLEVRCEDFLWAFRDGGVRTSTSRHGGPTRPAVERQDHSPRRAGRGLCLSMFACVSLFSIVG